MCVCLALFNHIADCEYTCHHKCRQHVTIDCVGTIGGTANGASPQSNVRSQCSHKDACLSQQPQAVRSWSRKDGTGKLFCKQLFMFWLVVHCSM